MRRALHKSPSQTALLGIAALMLLLFFVGRKWEKGNVIEQDVNAYYAYLPATFIYKDITMNYVNGNDFFADKVWGTIWKDGMGPVQKYTMGMAVVYAPFFAAGHVSALLSHHPADGYSNPYQFWLQFSAVFFLVLGLFHMRKVLLRYFSDPVVAVVLLILAFGTNLFYYTTVKGTMPHVYLFSLISIFLWRTIRFYELPTWRNALYLGLCGALITLIRPNHILIWLIPVLYDVYDRRSLIERFHFLRRHFLKYLIWPVLVVLLYLPQFFYWRLLTDHWLYYSYRDEGFFFADPAVLNTFFSFRNGWLTYTPLMVLGLGGLLLLHRYVRRFAVAGPVFFLLSTYVIASWWCWWYGGSFGSRVFIDLYPVLALGLAACLSFLGARLVSWAKRVGMGMIGLFMLLNVFQSAQSVKGLIHYDAMTPKAYFSVFGKWRAPENLESMLAHPDYEAAKRGEGRQ